MIIRKQKQQDNRCCAPSSTSITQINPAETKEKGETGREGHFSAVFYANDGMFGASDPAWLQGAFSALVALFDRVGLRTNVDKTVSMVCHPCWAGPATGPRRDTGGD